MYIAITNKEYEERNYANPDAPIKKNIKFARIIKSNDEFETYLKSGALIIYRDNNEDIIIGENGKWLKDKPNIDNEIKFESFTPKIQEEIYQKIIQNAADVAYLSMMTGVSL